MASFLEHDCSLPAFPPSIEAEGESLDDTLEHVIASASGPLSACDVWFNVGAAWLDRVTVRVYALTAAARVLVARASLARVPSTIGPDERLSGVAATLRGRPCSGFELTIQATAGAALEAGHFYMQAWHEPTAPHAASELGGAPALATPTMVAAALLARDEDSGELKEIVVDGDGRFVMGNPLFTDQAEALLNGATPDPTPDTLALRGEDAECGFARLDLVSSTVAGAPSSGTSWLWAQDRRLHAKEPNGVTDAFTYADATAGAGTKLHRRYLGRVTTTDLTITPCLVVPAADLPTTNWSAHVTARIHAYDVEHDKAHKFTREAGVRKTAGSIVIPVQDQIVGTDLDEGEECQVTIGLGEGSIAVFVQSRSSDDVRWAAWLDLLLVAH